MEKLTNMQELKNALKQGRKIRLPSWPPDNFLQLSGLFIIDQRGCTHDDIGLLELYSIDGWEIYRVKSQLEWIKPSDSYYITTRIKDSSVTYLAREYNKGFILMFQPNGYSHYNDEFIGTMLGLNQAKHIAQEHYEGLNHE